MTSSKTDVGQFTCCHKETGQRDHDFCLSRSHYTDTGPTSWEGRGDRTRDFQIDDEHGLERGQQGTRAR